MKNSTTTGVLWGLFMASACFAAGPPISVNPAVPDDGAWCRYCGPYDYDSCCSGRGRGNSCNRRDTFLEDPANSRVLSVTFNPALGPKTCNNCCAVTLRAPEDPPGEESFGGEHGQAQSEFGEPGVGFSQLSGPNRQPVPGPDGGDPNYRPCTPPPPITCRNYVSVSNEICYTWEISIDIEIELPGLGTGGGGVSGSGSDCTTTTVEEDCAIEVPGCKIGEVQVRIRSVHAAYIIKHEWFVSGTWQSIPICGTCPIAGQSFTAGPCNTKYSRYSVRQTELDCSVRRIRNCPPYTEPGTCP